MEPADITTPAALHEALADRYLIERTLGAGGMATVYLARDLKHERHVAVKVLHPDLAAALGAERFLAEIRTTANLQHPHILALHDSGVANGFLYYVMPFVRGESLRERIGRERQLSLADGLKIATEVAGALDYAHRHGVIHRDIKPENILLHDGTALVADFGIALAVSSASGARLTQTGLSLGTPQYMSPEQATGERTVDARSDVYALGAVTYEMLTGEAPFSGPTARAVVAKLLTEEPRAPRTLRKSIPVHAEHAILTALAKIPADRFSGPAEFAIALTNPAFTTSNASSIASGATPRRRWTPFMLGLAAVAVLLTVGLITAIRHERTPVGPSVYDVGLADSAQLIMNRYQGFSVAASGTFLVYQARHDSTTMLWSRSLRDGTTLPIAGTEGAYGPRVSPDGERVAFFDNAHLKIVPVAGGGVKTLGNSAEAHAWWVSNSRLLVVDNSDSRARWFEVEGGETAIPMKTVCIVAFWWPQGSRMLCGGNDNRAYVVDPATGTSAALQSAQDSKSASTNRALTGSHFRVVDQRYLTFMSPEGDLKATSFDPATLRVGRPVTMVAGIRMEGYTGVGKYDVAANGTLVYVPGENTQVGRLVKTRGVGPPTPLPIEAAAFLRWGMSADGRRLAAVVRGTRQQELRIYDLTDGRSTTWLGAHSLSEPRWNPRGDRIAVTIRDSASHTVTIVGSPTAASPPDTILRGVAFTPEMFRSDREILGRGPGGFARVTLDGKRSRLDTLAANSEAFSALSPDGRWIVFGRVSEAATVLMPYPSLDRRHVIAEPVVESRWLSPNELTFWMIEAAGGATWYRVRIGESADRPVGTLRRWFSDPSFSDTPGWSFSLAPDGSVVYVQGAARTTATYLRVVPHWVETMKRAVDAANR